MEASGAGSDGQFACSFCYKSFGRAEHCKRHELIHESTKPFSCSLCPKAFVRKDALQRHGLTHRSSIPSLSQLGARACMNCADARVRCSGEACCSRCSQRALQCLYPTSVTTQVRPAGTQGSSGHDGSRNTTFTPDSMLDHDQQVDQGFWDPSILASTNWLGTIDLDGFDLIAPNLSVHAGSDLSQQNVQLWSGSPLTRFSNASAVSTGTSGRESDVRYHPDDPESQETHGLHYLDGEPTRQPRTKRRKRCASTSIILQSGNDFTLRQPKSPTVENTLAISPSVYEQLESAYHRYCLAPSPMWEAFEAADLPTKDFFEELLSLSCDRFIPTLPLIHVSSFTTGDLNWATVAALAALGSHYIESEHKHIFIASMHEFVRRTVSHMSQSPGHPPSMGPVEYCQLLLLHSVGAAYCGDTSLLQQALAHKDRLANVFQIASQECHQISHEEREKQRVSAEGEDWQAWRRRETTIRVAYSAWLMDGMWAYHFEQRPSLDFCDGSIPLPCHEHLWNAETAQEWTAARHRQDATSVQDISLVKAMAELYIDKSLPRDRGEFARILMIHALFQRLWEVEQALANPLSWWEPSIRRQQSAAILPQEPVWLPSIPSYVAWQNASCDALDILHWQANATIGQASGMEHPTVLHLHLARIVLLVPCSALIRLAQTLSEMLLHGRPHQATTNSTITDKPMDSADAQALRSWATAHQFKARLAAIHAGVVFWHVRRYSADAFHEAPAVALAALTLWAFGVFAKPRRQEQLRPQQQRVGTSEGASRDEGEGDRVCEIILLDRPTDDELVQHFIKNGSAMRAHISCVGDLYEAGSPGLVLRQGCKLLEDLEQCWGVARSWNSLLRNLSGSDWQRGRESGVG